MMKRILLLALCAMTLVSPPVRTDVFRLHIIANSDSSEDQRIKLEVRDALLEYERERSNGCADAADAEASLMSDGSGIFETANTALEACGAEYGARLAVGEYDFPEREYAGEIYPAGRYRALRVVLGEGQGKNWWCVMFPPLCILELPGGKLDYDELGGIEFNSYIIQLIKRIDGGRLWEQISEKLR